MDANDKQTVNSFFAETKKMFSTCKFAAANIENQVGDRNGMGRLHQQEAGNRRRSYVVDGFSRIQPETFSKSRRQSIQNRGGVLMKTKNKGAGKPAPKTSTERGQTRTAKDNAWAEAVSNGKYKTLRSLMGAIHQNKIALVVKQSIEEK